MDGHLTGVSVVLLRVETQSMPDNRHPIWRAGPDYRDGTFYLFAPCDVEQTRLTRAGPCIDIDIGTIAMDRDGTLVVSNHLQECARGSVERRYCNLACIMPLHSCVESGWAPMAFGTGPSCTVLVHEGSRDTLLPQTQARAGSDLVYGDIRALGGACAPCRSRGSPHVHRDPGIHEQALR